MDKYVILSYNYIKERDDMMRQLPYGQTDYKKLIEKDYYYVDKTMYLQKLEDTKDKIVYLRPRRFGKSLFLSMLDNFFNIEYKEINKYLFKDLKISKSNYYEELSTRPVIKLSFKDLKESNFSDMYNSFKEIIRQLY